MSGVARAVKRSVKYVVKKTKQVFSGPKAPPAPDTSVLRAAEARASKKAEALNKQMRASKANRRGRQGGRRGLLMHASTGERGVKGTLG